ncbi:MAG: ParB/RepB/Spo0J family partition protein, partial [Alphaproteobacteria bacterium]|nr:ParB/RepB/Spo0J family partition protein [Alphaproteobacteria bacterium]
LEVALIENLQRSDMNPIDEAHGFAQLAKDFGYSHKEIASRIGKSRSYITNLIRLIQLPEDIQQKVIKKEMSVSHARSLLNVENAEELSEEITENKLSVRDLEERVKRQKNTKEQTILQTHFTGKSDLQNDLVRVKIAEYEKEVQTIFGAGQLQTQKDGKVSLSFIFESFEALSGWLNKYKA